MKYLAKLATTLFISIATTSTHAEASTEFICSYAPSQSEAVNRISALLGGGAAGAEAILISSGLTVVSHSSGMPILTGAGGYIAGTMTGALVTSVVIPVGVVVGGAVTTLELACAPKNHPELVQKVLDGAKEYSASAGNAFTSSTKNWQNISQDKFDAIAAEYKKYKTISQDKFYEIIGESWYQKAIRKTKASMGIS